MAQHGGARPGAGRRRTTRRITREAATALRLLAWQRYGRPTTDDEEDTLLSALVLEQAPGAVPVAAETGGERP